MKTKIKSVKFTIFLCIISALYSNAQCRLDKSNYHIVFEDNFNTYTNISQLKNVWQLEPDDRWMGWGGNSGEYYDESQVSLQPNGILRLSAKKLTTPFSCFAGGVTRNPNWVSGMLQTKKNLTYDPPMPNQGYPWTQAYATGYRYGMFEIRCKLPNSSCCFPAFWLWGGYSEIDIFEYNGNPNINTFFTTQHYQGTTSANQHCGNLFTRTTNNNLTDDFHTYTCVWTPTKVTIFFDNREIVSRDANLIPTFNQCNSLIANLAMYNGACSNTSMDIDYIKVYKPNLDDYNLPFKSSQDFMNTNVFEIEPNNTKVNNNQGSIATNSNNSNEVFYRGKDNRMYKSVFNGVAWTTHIIPYNYSPSLPNSLIGGCIKYNSIYNYILYVGQDYRIQYFGNSLSSWHWFIDDNWGSNANLCSKKSGAIDITSDGKIVYRGLDDKIHIFKFNSVTSHWDQLNISYTYGVCSGMPDADYVDGDVVVDQVTNNIIYRGRDGRLQLFWQSSPFVYQHTWIDNNFGSSTNLVSNTPGSIISTNLGIFYKGDNGKLQRFYWDGVSMVHQEANYTYNNCAGMSDADMVKGSLSYLPAFRYILYIGRDGRVQRFEIPVSNSSNMWQHYWIDDYWNTFDFASYNSSSTSSFGSLVTSSDGKMFYNNEKRSEKLAFFKFEPCERLNPTCNSTFDVHRMSNPIMTNEMKSNKNNLSISPNPSKGNFKISLLNPSSYPIKVKVFNLNGIEVYNQIFSEESESIFEKEIYLNHLKSGLYIVRIWEGSKLYTEKLMIEE